MEQSYFLKKANLSEECQQIVKTLFGEAWPSSASSLAGLLAF
jgi:hypothetical protein